MNLTKKDIHAGKYGPAFAKTILNLEENLITVRIREKDTTVWKKGDEYETLITNRLGWIFLPELMTDACDSIISFADELRNEGFRYAVVLGMGGSSMCPEVCREVFGVQQGYLDLKVLDSTDPETLLKIEKSIDIEKTIFIVASKSGGTIEVDSFFRYFFNKVKNINPENPGSRFVAITDPSTELESRASENRFRKIFINPSDIGGRYSALSYFGLVPAALIGVDIKKLITNAKKVMYNCLSEEAGKNFGLITGALAGTLAENNVNKLTFILPRKIRSFGYWAEQLIAESTGKEGKGIVPVESEKLSSASDYGKDRFFVNIRSGKASKKEKESVKKIKKNNFPLIEIKLNDIYDIGGQFYLWEYATSIMGCILGINPFDEPNVKESKDNTGEVLKYYQDNLKLPVQTPLYEGKNYKLFLNDEMFSKNLSGKKMKRKWKAGNYIKYFINKKRSGDYFAIMAYIESSKENKDLLSKIRELLKRKLNIATTVGFGPRFLHSTGQLHKGGDDSGMFLQIVNEDKKDALIPGKPYSFSVLKQAQAIGDFESLLKHKRRVIKINTGKNVTGGLKKLYSDLKKVL
ncbi:MAG: hypothetical protein JST15_09550 [Bacteroidetes bacterium]|nr:hypothetical protein [Bacteroidota bacterium]